MGRYRSRLKVDVIYEGAEESKLSFWSASIGSTTRGQIKAEKGDVHAIQKAGS
jgi:hypothetical protein